MSANLPSLWDNLHLENGYDLLKELKLEEAVQQFHLALNSFGEKEEIEKNISTCQYWQDRLEQLAGDTTKNLLADYSSFDFTPQMNGFRKALLRHVVAQMEEAEALNEVEVKTAFDLLLQVPDYEEAEDLISKYIKQKPKDHSLLYLLAQAQWLKKERVEANENYLKALLYQPDKKFIDRIENLQLKQVIGSCGPEMAPAYGWIWSVVPFVPIPKDIKALDEAHQKALDGYRLLKEANKALVNHDRKLAIQYRKELKTQSPEIYEEYFEILKKRE